MKQNLSDGMLIAYLFGLLYLFLLSFEYLIILLPVYLSKYLMGRYFNKWIGGFTGDCIGATQQVGELVLYISYIVVVI
ncbi:MAG: adenosylcobinamide-GDP ribazoletransferase [Marinifilaceae bacterium]